MKEKLKDLIYGTALFFAKLYWKICKPVTFGARIILANKEKVLLVQHKRPKTWNLPGGGIKKHENPALAGIRELYEETGLQIENTDYLLGTYVSKDEGKHDTIYVYVKKVDEKFLENKKVNLEIELQDAEWFDYNNLPETITRRTKYRIDEYLASKRDIDGLWGEINI